MASAFSKIPFRWKLTALMACAAALNGADRVAFSTMIPPVRADLGMSDLQIGLTGTLFLWSYALAAPLGGFLGDRWSRSRIMLWSVGVWSFVTLLSGLSTSVVMLLGLRCVLGLSESLFLPSAFSLTAVHHPGAVRARAITILSIGNHVGVIVGGALAGLIAEAWGWRWSFGLLGAVGLAWVAVARPIARDEPAAPAEATLAHRPEKPGVAETLACLIRIPSFLVILFSVMMGGMAIFVFLSWLPLYLRETYHLALASAGFMGFFALKAPSICGLGAGGWLSDKAALRNPRHRMQLRAAGYLVCAPFLFLFFLRPSLATILGGIALFSFIRSVADANEIPIVCDVVPPRYRSTAFGLLTASITVAGGAGVLITSLAKQHFGLETVFASLSAAYVLAGVLMYAAFFWFMPRDLARVPERLAGETRAAHA